MAIKDHIPNFITILNLLSGCIAIVFAFEDQLMLTSIFIGLAAVFDFFDGFAARLLNVKNKLGKDLDSLADVISFGLAPGVILFQMTKYSINSIGIVLNSQDIIAFIGFLIPAFSALRLAKFNNDERQLDQFIGMPTPANALLIASFPLIFTQQSTLIGVDPGLFSSLLSNTYVLVAVTVLLAYLLVAEIHLFSLKFKTLKWNENKIKYIFMSISFTLLIALGYLSFPLIFILYIIFSAFLKNQSTS